MITYIVIPAYNEEQKIAEIIKDVQKMCSSIIVVDDGSSDATYEIARQEGTIALRHLVNRGQGAALQTGITYALQKGAECIVTFDADGQHDVSDIPALLKPIQDGVAEVVLGTRFLNSKLKVQSSKLQLKTESCKDYVPLLRRGVLKLGLLHQWFFTGLKVSDASCGLRAFSRYAAGKIVITQDRMAHASEILERIGVHKLIYTEVPAHIAYTPYSLKKGQKNFSGSLRVLYDFFMGRIL
jgi:glycosyltransferase involved in cell wall biosynthesis